MTTAETIDQVAVNQEQMLHKMGYNFAIIRREGTFPVAVFRTYDGAKMAFKDYPEEFMIIDFRPVI